MKRIEEFLLDPETHAAHSFDAEADSIFTKEKIGIEMHDAVLQYEGHDGHGFKLTVPRFEVRPGEVVAVVGRVGAGKTAMLDALLGNMPIKGGSVRVGGRIAYVPQVCSSLEMCSRLHSCYFRHLFLPYPLTHSSLKSSLPRLSQMIICHIGPVCINLL